MTPRVKAILEAWFAEGLSPQETFEAHREEIEADQEILDGLRELLAELN